MKSLKQIEAEFDKRKRENWNRWYLRHKEQFLDKCKKYNKTEQGKKIVAEVTKRQKEKYPERWKARQQVRNFVYRGKINRGVCSVCGEIKTEAHHDDYSKPLEVTWLCQKHHRELHGGQNEDNIRD